MPDFTCESCHRKFTKTRSDEEALAEAESYFPNIRQVKQAVICDDCFGEIIKTIN